MQPGNPRPAPLLCFDTAMLQINRIDIAELQQAAG